MYADILPFLQCPVCATRPLSLVEADEADGEIVAGVLRCTFCSTQTQIVDGIWNTLAGHALPLTPAQITNYLPLAAKGYEPLWRWQALSLMSGRRFPLREELTLLRHLIQPRADQIFVDVACSVGLYARTLARDGATVVGVDHSWAMLRQARRVAKQQGLRISYVRARAQALPFVDGAAAGATMGGSLNEIGDEQGALSEMARVTQADGRLFCMNLLQAESGWGRALQDLLGTGGIDFFDQPMFNNWLINSGWQPRAQWRWRVVAITLARRAHVAPTVTPGI
jgi:SAM-dependent methyltransferase